MHDNSLEAYKKLSLSKRYHLIYQIYDVFGELTDREVVEKLGFTDMNMARPRITEMIKGTKNVDPLLIDVGKKKDSVTGATVRVVRVRRKEEVNKNEFQRELCFS